MGVVGSTVVVGSGEGEAGSADIGAATSGAGGDSVGTGSVCAVSSVIPSDYHNRLTSNAEMAHSYIQLSRFAFLVFLRAAPA